MIHMPQRRPKQRWPLVVLLIGRLLLALALPGCASVDRLAATLNARQVTSCIDAIGLYPPFIMVHVTMATGGATVHECKGR